MNVVWDKVRKFGLEYCDLPTMLWNISVLLRVLTVNIDSQYKGGIPLSSYIITIVTVGCNLYVYLFSVIWFIFWRCVANRDVLAALIVFSEGVGGAIGNFKFLYMCLHMAKIKNIADKYLMCDSQTIPDSRFSNNLLLSLRNVKRRAITNWIMIMGNGVLYILIPALTPGRILPENYLVIYGLEPVVEAPNYEISYFMYTASVFFVCLASANVSGFFIITAGYIESQTLALSKEMLQLLPDAIKKANEDLQLEEFDQFDSRILINKHVGKRLKEIIVRHALIRDMFRQLEEVFSGAVTMGFILMVLGVIASLLGKLENTYLQIPFALMQVAMDCFIGQRMIDASGVFENAVYNCGWENFEKDNMTMVLVILQNAQNTMMFSAGGVATLSFSCLMTIIRGIYSTYTGFRTTVK